MLTRLLPALALHLSLALACSSAQAQDFSDAFDGAASGLWGNELGHWSAAGGSYGAQSPQALPDTYSSLPFLLKAYTVDVDVTDVRDGGLWLRSIDNQNGVLLVTGGASTSGRGLSFDTLVGGVLSQGIVRTGPLFEVGATLHLRAVVTEDSFVVYLNGATEPTLSFQSTLFLPGRFALYSNSSQRFDNVSLSAVPEPAAAQMLALGLIVLGACRRARGRSRGVAA